MRTALIRRLDVRSRDLWRAPEALSRHPCGRCRGLGRVQIGARAQQSQAVVKPVNQRKAPRHVQFGDLISAQLLQNHDEYPQTRTVPDDQDVRKFLDATPEFLGPMMFNPVAHYGEAFRSRRLSGQVELASNGVRRMVMFGADLRRSHVERPAKRSVTTRAVLSSDFTLRTPLEAAVVTLVQLPRRIARHRLPTASCQNRIRRLQGSLQSRRVCAGGQEVCLRQSNPYLVSIFVASRVQRLVDPPGELLTITSVGPSMSDEDQTVHGLLSPGCWSPSPCR
ncbi:MAG: hypothetical protein JWR52_3482 [Marmoricola sp.]|nr:hypothetical protein [Marmoricola sp.]